MSRVPAFSTYPKNGTTNSDYDLKLFEAVSVDLGYLNGMHYLVLMDRYSGWPLVKPLKKLDTGKVRIYSFTTHHKHITLLEEI